MVAPQDVFEAAAAGDVSRLAALLDGGVDPNARDDEGYALLSRAIHNAREDVVRLLLDRGACAAERTRRPPRPDGVVMSAPNTDTLLHAAARHGTAAIVRLLVQHGASPRTGLAVEASPLKKPRGARAAHSPLHVAVEQGNLETTLALLDARADPNARAGALDEFSGETALLLAIEWEREPIVHAILARGANPNRARSDGFTPLMIAASRASATVLQALLDAGADPNAPARGRTQGWTALHAAAAAGHVAHCRALLAHGASREARLTAARTIWSPEGTEIYPEGATPLNLARLRRRADVVRLFDPGTVP